jgi:transglutaminase-like putative cysteine protease
MTSAATTTRTIAAERTTAWPRLGPAEGWASLVLLGFLCWVVGWAIDDARWVLGPQTLTDSLAWSGVLGMAWGAGSGLLRRGRLFTHLGGAVVATVVLSIFVGLALRTRGTPGDLFQATSNSLAHAFIDLVVKRHQTTTEVGHFVLTLSILCWGTGQFAGYAAFGHRRPLAAVLVPGAILLVNVALTTLDQFPALVLFTLAALAFLLRFHIADEERTWRRHRIGDVGDAVAVYLRTGAVFVAIAIAGALLLTRSASSAPLAGAWSGVDQRLIDAGNVIARLFPAGGPGTRLGGPGFGSTVSIGSSWVTDDSPVVTMQTRRDWTPAKWRGAAYDSFSGIQWTQTGSHKATVAAGDQPFSGTGDAPVGNLAYTTETFTVSGPNGAPGIVYSPGITMSVDRETQPTLVTRGGSTFWAVLGVASGGQYVGTVAVPDLSKPADPGTLTANRLRLAGTDYPPDLLALYTDLQPGAIGAATEALAKKIVADAHATNPYDIARATESYLRDGANFTYSTDVSDMDCGAAGVVECFVINRRGYCEYYASTMVMMLRVEGIPARFIEGFLPGERDQNGVETIRRNRAHAWVQVWFPGSGWIDFDPTGGGRGSALAIPAGGPAASAQPASPGATVRPGGDEGRDPLNPSRGPSSSGATSTGFVPIVLGGLLAILAVVGTILYRRAGRPADPETTYRTVAALAARLGHGRRPAQTVSEYMGTLSDAVPSVRPELQLVGASTVEAVYGRKRLSPARLAALGEARRRLRVALLRLVFIRRRPRDRGRRRG